MKIEKEFIEKSLLAGAIGLVGAEALKWLWNKYQGGNNGVI